MLERNCTMIRSASRFQLTLRFETKGLPQCRAEVKKNTLEIYAEKKLNEKTGWKNRRKRTQAETKKS